MKFSISVRGRSVLVTSGEVSFSFLNMSHSPFIFFVRVNVCFLST